MKFVVDYDPKIFDYFSLGYSMLRKNVLIYDLAWMKQNRKLFIYLIREYQNIIILLSSSNIRALLKI